MSLPVWLKSRLLKRLGWVISQAYVFQLKSPSKWDVFQSVVIFSIRSGYRRSRVLTWHGVKQCLQQQGVSGLQHRYPIRRWLSIGFILIQQGQLAAAVCLVRAFRERTPQLTRRERNAILRLLHSANACDDMYDVMTQSTSATPLEEVDLVNMPAVLFHFFEKLHAPVVQLQDRIPNRLCYILHMSLPHTSVGYATRSHGIILGLQKAGWDVIAVTRPGFPKGNDQEADQVEGVTYHRVGLSRIVGENTAAYVEESAAVWRAYFETVRPACVVAASNYRTALPALVAARALGIPFVYEVRGFWELTRSVIYPFFSKTVLFHMMQRVETRLCQESDSVLTLTHAMCTELQKRGVPRATIHLIPNACDLTRFVMRPRDRHLMQKLGIPEAAPVVGYVGTLLEYEGLDDLIEASIALYREGLSFYVLLVGNEGASRMGMVLPRLRRRMEQAGFSQYFITPGRVPHHEVAAYYSLIDICPFPRKPYAVCEAVSPLKPLEALAMQKAVLVSSVAPLLEMITHEATGLVFEKGSVVDLGLQLKRFLLDPALRTRCGLAGCQWVNAERSWERVTDVMGEVLRDCIS